MPDAEEIRLGTNPNNPDTDGDGYSDGVELNAGSDPKDPHSVPEGLSIYTAVELELITLSGKQYQLETSVDLDTWTSYEGVFTGTGGKTSKLISIKDKQFTYWRLKMMP